MGSEGRHEPFDRLSGDVIDRHRAISTIMEELEERIAFHVQSPEAAVALTWG